MAAILAAILDREVPVLVTAKEHATAGAPTTAMIIDVSS